jgi:hypothetical protein
MSRAKGKATLPPLQLGTVRLPKGVHPEGFGLHVVGNCLSPRAENGQIAIVEPVLPEPGDMAVFWFKGQKTPVVKILVTPLRSFFPAHPQSEVVLIVQAEQLNPPKRYSVEADKIERLCRVHSLVAGDTLEVARDPEAAS